MTHKLGMIITRFTNTDLSDYPAVTGYNRALDAGLWVLWVSRHKFKIDDYLIAEEISAILRALEVSFKPIEIIRAFARAGKKLDVKQTDNMHSYQIMRKGVEYLKSLQGFGDVDVWHIDGKKPWSSPVMFRLATVL